MLGSSGPLEAKVGAATGGSIVGTALAGAIMWALDTYMFRAGEVPDPIVILVWAVIPAGLTFFAGFRARHTPRSDRDASTGVHDAEVERLADRDARRSDPLQDRLPDPSPPPVPNPGISERHEPGEHRKP